MAAGREKDMGGVLREVTAEHAAATSALRHGLLLSSTITLT